MTQEFLKEIPESFREIREILRFQCKLYTAYMGNYSFPCFNLLFKMLLVFNVF